MATTKIADSTKKRMNSFRKKYDISFKHIATEGAEQYMDDYEAHREELVDEDGEDTGRD